MTVPDELAERYLATLRGYAVASESEALLAEAYVLGREAIDTGLGVFDLAWIHETALSSLLAPDMDASQCVRVVHRASGFAREALAPFEMVQRGFHEANALLERERETLSGLEGLADGIVLVDSADRIHYCNVRAATLLGTTTDRLLTERARVVSALLGVEPAALAEAGGLLELSDRSANSARRDLRVERFDWGDPLEGRFGLLLRDITAERELARAKDRFIGVVSHEMRSPLASIMGFATILGGVQGLDERERGFVRYIDDEAHRLADLVDDFLDIERIEGGMFTLECRPVELPALIGRAVVPFRGDARRPIVLNVPGDASKAWADERRVLQVLVNLLSNAVKYSPAGGEIALELAENDDTLTISVTDHGVGLAADVIPLVFDKLFRADTPQTRGISGTGLGLAICRDLVEAQGGRIWAESGGLDQGSQFCFTLPTPTGRTRDAGLTDDEALPAVKRQRGWG